MRKILFSCVAIVAFGLAQSQVYFSDNFDSGNMSAWTLYDQDGDGHQWQTVALDPPITPAIASYSYDNATGTALTPDNYIVSPAIDLSSATLPLLKFKVKGQDPDWAAEHYAVYVANSNSVAAFLATTPVLEETVTDNGAGGQFYSKELDLSAYKGQSQVYIAIRHFQSSDQFAIHIDDFSVEESPTSVPNCATLGSPADAASNISYFSVPLTWSAPTTGATVTSYEVYFDTNANPTTLVSTQSTLSYTATNLNPSTTYYWKVIAKNAVGAATGCQVYSFKTMDPTYCQAGATNTQFEKISNVTFAGINNSSTSTAGYEDFTAVSGSVAAGQTNIPFTASFTGTSYSSDQVLVWIDFNGDKDFDDANELVLTTATSTAPWSGTISIPADAVVGTTRMRVRLHDSSLTPNSTPCGNSSYGQVEDYSLNIGPALGTSDVQARQVMAYPNPVKDIFTIEAKTKIKSVRVFDAAGKLVLTRGINEAKSQIDFSRMNVGVYLVQTTLENGSVSSTKVIKE